MAGGAARSGLNRGADVQPNVAPKHSARLKQRAEDPVPMLRRCPSSIALSFATCAMACDFEPHDRVLASAHKPARNFITSVRQCPGTFDFAAAASDAAGREVKFGTSRAPVANE
jgi:hypothetical protein